MSDSRIWIIKFEIPSKRNINKGQESFIFATAHRTRTLYPSTYYWPLADKRGKMSMDVVPYKKNVILSLFEIEHKLPIKNIRHWVTESNFNEHFLHHKRS